MKFHPKALLAVVGVALVLMVASDVRLGIAAIVALTAIDALSFLAPVLLTWPERGRRVTRRN